MLGTFRKTTQIFDLFSVHCPEWGVTEVARELELPKSTVCMLMSSLVEQRFLSRTEDSRYRLGWRLFELSRTLLDTTEFRIEARKVMEDLVTRWKETVHLAVLDGTHVVYLDKLQPSPAVQISVSWAGARLPAHCSGLGKVLLAYSEWERVAAGLESGGMPALTSNTITTVDDLASELTEVRRLGYAYDIEEISVGLCCVAAPIYAREGTVVAAVSFSVPSVRFEQDRDEYTAAIIEAAQTVSSALNNTKSGVGYDYSFEEQKA